MFTVYMFGQIKTGIMECCSKWLLDVMVKLSRSERVAPRRAQPMKTSM
jgi:hypothetical protein